ncbi:MAG: DNA alkylation repair protein [Rhodospirillaceae bacterium]
MPDSKARTEPAPSAFKDFFDRALVEDMAHHLHRVWPQFDKKSFVAAAVKNFASLALKQRADQIAAALAAFLPGDVPRALKVLTASLRPLRGHEPDPNPASGVAGWAVWPYGAFVAAQALEHPHEALAALREITIRSTSEFAIRPFLVRHTELTLSTLREWSKDENHHVRRLVSEGTRPRLPWGLRLKAFVKNPAPILPLLEALRDDPSDYVRRSVANSLNDIAKDHPDLVAAVAMTWLKNASAERARLVRHACRTLIKKGHRPALKALGFEPGAKVKLRSFSVSPAKLTFGSALTLKARLASTARTAQKIVLDYVVHHRKKNGTSAKVFKWKTLTLGPGETIDLARKHAIRRITTRVYYPGMHKIELAANGRVLGAKNFRLEMS